MSYISIIAIVVAILIIISVLLQSSSDIFAGKADNLSNNDLLSNITVTLFCVFVVLCIYLNVYSDVKENNDFSDEILDSVSEDINAEV